MRLGLIAALLLVSSTAYADDPPAPAPSGDPQPVTAEQVNLEKDQSAKVDINAPEPEAPPPIPYKKTLVIDSSVGALGFVGQFGKVAPPGLWLRSQLGYELLKWLMVYGEGELGFSDNSNRQDPPNIRAFPIFGFGGGARFSIRFSERVGIYAQGGLGLMKAYIRTNGLGILGFKDAEDLNLYLGGRLGFEWFQVDRHLALGLNGGLRIAEGFSRIAGGDTPFAIDGGLSLRYAF